MGEHITELGKDDPVLDRIRHVDQVAFVQLQDECADDRAGEEHPDRRRHDLQQPPGEGRQHEERRQATDPKAKIWGFIDWTWRGTSPRTAQNSWASNFTPMKKGPV